ncbi:Hypothetical predicted protein [Mytilus galloprovincialis]|uniref:Uncharacterized protein n=1 Tax=Mytilus galloprovincialis TaxID=29158 RepID=A0A8B6F1U0_MYTGA|nr:Hypothetical predicted protein [Mytilus galloprovincialis]
MANNTFHGMGIIAGITPGTKRTAPIPRISVSSDDINSIAKVNIQYYKPQNDFMTKLNFSELRELRGMDKDCMSGFTVTGGMALKESNTRSVSYRNEFLRLHWSHYEEFGASGNSGTYIYAPNAVTHMLSGKAVARAIRGHMLVDTALHSLLVSKIFNFDFPADENEEGNINVSVDDILSKAADVYTELLEGTLSISSACDSAVLQSIKRNNSQTT